MVKLYCLMVQYIKNCIKPLDLFFKQENTVSRKTDVMIYTIYINAISNTEIWLTVTVVRISTKEYLFLNSLSITF
jgi:hypothetical protein